MVTPYTSATYREYSVLLHAPCTKKSQATTCAHPEGERERSTTAEQEPGAQEHTLPNHWQLVRMRYTFCARNAAQATSCSTPAGSGT